jgi:hypothetical protein
MFYSHPYDTAARPNVTPNAQMCPGAQHRHPREDLIAAPRTTVTVTNPAHASPPGITRTLGSDRVQVRCSEEMT